MITFVVLHARAIQSKVLFALVDVEMMAGGVSFVICGVQARRIPSGGTSVHLPTYKGVDGAWLPAIRLPDELGGPLADAVLEFLVVEGLATHRHAPPQPR